MRKSIFYLFCIVVFTQLNSCRKSDGKPTSTEIGTSEIDLNAHEAYIRKSEAEIGNLICDALKIFFEEKGETIDFVLVNGGNIRYNSQLRPNGIYPKGKITSEMIDEMLPFENSSYIIQLSGKQLKEILERAVAQYPLAKGPFMQCSKELKYIIDTLQAPQILNIEETSIESEGSRIDSIYVNGTSFVQNQIYYVLFSDYIGEGNDGFVSLKNIPYLYKKKFSDNQSNAVKDFIILNSSVNPKKENRIIFK